MGAALSRPGSGAAIDGLIAEHTRSAGRIGCCVGSKTSERRPAGPPRHIPWRHRRGLRRHAATFRAKLLEPIFGIVLHPLELHLELLIAILKLLDCAGQLTERIFDSVEADGRIARVGLRNPARRWGLGSLRRLGGLARLRRGFAAAEKIVQEIAGRTLVLSECDAGKNGTAAAATRSFKT